MNSIFMCLLACLKPHGKIKTALLKDEGYSTVTIKRDDAEYLITVIKKEVEEDTNV